MGEGSGYAPPVLKRLTLADAVFAAHSSEGFNELIRLYDEFARSLPRSELHDAEHAIIRGALRTGEALDRAEQFARAHLEIERSRRRLMQLADVLVARGDLSREAAMLAPRLPWD